MKKASEENTELSALTAQADALIQQGRDYLIKQGKMVDLSEWVTIKKYCDLYDIENTETVSNWIRRGIVPADDTMVMEDFNNLRMIRAKEYLIGAERRPATKPVA